MQPVLDQLVAFAENFQMIQGRDERPQPLGREEEAQRDSAGGLPRTHSRTTPQVAGASCPSEIIEITSLRHG